MSDSEAEQIQSCTELDLIMDQAPDTAVAAVKIGLTLLKYFKSDLTPEQQQLIEKMTTELTTRTCSCMHRRMEKHIKFMETLGKIKQDQE